MYNFVADMYHGTVVYKYIFHQVLVQLNESQPLSAQLVKHFY